MTRWTEDQYREAQARTQVSGDVPIVVRPLNPKTVRINIPFPPTVNHIWKSSGSKRYLSKEYESFLGIVGVIVGRERVPKFGTKRLAIALELHWPNKRKGDIDNRAKAVLDALARAGVYDDDEQVDMLAINRGNIVKGGLCVVTLEALP